MEGNIELSTVWIFQIAVHKTGQVSPVACPKSNALETAADLPLSPGQIARFYIKLEESCLLNISV